MKSIGLALALCVTGCGGEDGTEDVGGAGGGGAAGATATAGSSGSAIAMAGSGGSTGQTRLPTTVTIELLGALIGPGKSDSTQWDGSGTVPPEVLEALATAAGVPGTGAILSVIQDAAYQALSKPDPLGFAEVNEGSGFDEFLIIPLTSVDSNEEDTFTPRWPQPYPGWDDVAFNVGTQVRVTLTDEDLSEHDNIGVATLNFTDLSGAWLARDSHWIRVDDQTNNQLLAVQVQVTGAVD